MSTPESCLLQTIRRSSDPAAALEIFSALSPENQRKAILFLADLSIPDTPLAGDPEEDSCTTP